MTNTLHFKSNDLLEQHTRYVLVVTRELRDAAGKGIKAAKEFQNFVDDDVTGGVWRADEPWTASVQMFYTKAINRSIPIDCQ